MRPLVICISGTATWLSCTEAEVRIALSGTPASEMSKWSL